MGSSAYDPETVGKPAKQVFSHLIKLGARPLVTARSSTKQADGGKKSKSFMIGDCEVGDADLVFEKWMNGVLGALEEGDNARVTKGKKKYNGKNKQQVEKEGDCACKESGEETTGCCSSKADSGEQIGCCSTNEKQGDENGSSTDSLSEEDDEDDGSDIVDLEDMGNIMNEQNLELKTSEPKEMVTKKQAKVCFRYCYIENAESYVIKSG